MNTFFYLCEKLKTNNFLSEFIRFLLLMVVSFILFNFEGIDAQIFDYPISTVNIQNVKLNDNFWLPEINLIRKVTIPYAFDKCEKEGRIENFLIAGGKIKGKVRGKMPFDDTDLYKIIEGASYSLISHPDPKLDMYLDSIISIIKTGQEPDGYLTTWFTIDRAHPPANWVKPSTRRWENEISSHELYNSGHLFEAAAAHYLATGKRNFLDIALKNADLLCENFGPGKLQTVPGHQIVETGLIKLYRITQNTKYLELAKFYLDKRGDTTSHKLYGSYNQDHIPVTKQEEAVGHAVRAVYMYAGMTDIAAIYRDSAYLNSVNKIWENIIDKKFYITGGIGARHEGESFGDDYELPDLTGYAETCAAIGDVYWNQRMFLLTGDAKYYDIIERTLYNGLISGISMDGTKFFYPNPLESDGKYKFNMGSCTRQPWFDCSCCPTNLIRFIPSIPGLIYAVDDDDLFINLFISNKSKIRVNNLDVNVEQESDYPWDGHIKIRINPDVPQRFTVKVRVPYFVKEEPVPGSLYSYLDTTMDNVVLKVNGMEEEQVYNKGYLSVSKTWKKGDEIELIIPMKIREVITNDKVTANKNHIAFEYGPFVYCAEEVDDGKKFFESSLSDISGLKVEKKENMFNGIQIISCKAKYRNSARQNLQEDNNFNNLIFIPYYLWSNRGVGKMRLWQPVIY